MTALASCEPRQAASSIESSRGPIQLPGRAELCVEREDIQFADRADGRVAIRIVVSNQGTQPSQETVAEIHAAPFGAFVPWQPLAVLPLPSLRPGESHVLETEALRTRPKPLGPPDRVPPRRLLTALGAGDDQPQPQTGALAGAFGPMLRQFRPLWRTSSSNLADTPALPADLNDLLGQGNLYWAGNLNVFIGGKAVERHLSQALRIYPGQLNLAMFVVGSCQDAYQFHLEGEGAAWDAALYDFTRMPSCLADPREAPAIDTGDWIELRGKSMLFLTLCPPSDCGQGSVEVHVCQRSTGQTAIVEFSLDPRAAGPGCYVLS